MAIEPPDAGRDGWDRDGWALVQCDWGQRQCSEARTGAREWAARVWRVAASVRGAATRIWRRPARTEPS